MLEVKEIDGELISIIPFIKTDSKLIEAEMLFKISPDRLNAKYKMFGKKDLKKLDKYQEKKKNKKGKVDGVTLEFMANAYMLHDTKLFGYVDCDHIALADGSFLENNYGKI